MDRRIISMVASHKYRANHRRKLPAGVAALCVALGIMVYISLRALAVHDQPTFGQMDGSTLAIFDAQKAGRTVEAGVVGNEGYAGAGLTRDSNYQQTIIGVLSRVARNSQNDSEPGSTNMDFGRLPDMNRGNPWRARAALNHLRL